MRQKRTQGIEQTRWPVKTLRVEVVTGPDRGETHVASSDRCSVGTARGNDLVLSDPTVSRFHLELHRTNLGIEVIDHGSTNGTLSGKVRVQRATIAPGALLHLGQTQLRVGDGDDAELELEADDHVGDLAGRAPAMRHLFTRLRVASKSELPVLVVGEYGTGKQLVARTIHELSARADGPLVVLSCTSMAPLALARALFGDGGETESNALGALEQAEDGTLIIEGVSDLPLELQASLARVLESGHFQPLGSPTPRPLRARVIATTSHELRAEVNAGRFRPELYYRLAVLLFELPPLRERTADIPLLIQCFLDESDAPDAMNRLFDDAVLDSLAQHHWPGNVRELKNLVESTLAHGSVPILAPHGATAIEAPAALDFLDRLGELAYRDARGRLLQEFEGRYLRQLLVRADQNVSQAARLASMDRSHLISLLRRHRLRR